MTIRGIQEAQRANLKAIQALRPAGALGEAIRYGTTEAHRYAVIITHVDTGALRASHRMAVNVGGRNPHGQIYIDEASVNPHGHRPAEFGPEEHARGGGHSFYERVIRERAVQIGGKMLEIIRRGLP